MPMGAPSAFKRRHPETSRGTRRPICGDDSTGGASPVPAEGETLNGTHAAWKLGVGAKRNLVPSDGRPAW
jgi:hypothetical protein